MLLLGQVSQEGLTSSGKQRQERLEEPGGRASGLPAFPRLCTGFWPVWTPTNLKRLKKLL